MDAKMNMETQLIDAEPIVHRIANDRELAAELYQELWLSCLRQTNVNWSVSQIGRIIKLVQWIKVDNIRRMRVRRSEPIEFVSPEKLAIPRTVEGADFDSVEQLHAELADLPQAYREAIELHFFKQLPDELLACEKSVGAATVRQWRHRGVCELRSRLRAQKSKPNPVRTRLNASHNELQRDPKRAYLEVDGI